MKIFILFLQILYSLLFCLDFLLNMLKINLQLFLFFFNKMKIFFYLLLLFLSSGEILFDLLFPLVFLFLFTLNNIPELFLYLLEILYLFFEQLNIFLSLKITSF